MRRSTEFLSLLTGAALLITLPGLVDSIQGADGGPSALPRREDVTYWLPGIPEPLSSVLSWSTKFDNDAVFAQTDSVTPSVWVSGPVYVGLTWFWQETGLPGDIEFVGFAANQDTTIYSPAMLWLPLDPVSAASWQTTATSNKGETWTFRFSYDGLDTLIAGEVQDPQEFVCWRVLLEQEGPASVAEDGQWRDGMGVVREGFKEAKAFRDTLYYQADTLPRRRIASTSLFPQNALLYRSHTTRETPVPIEGTGVSRFKSRFRR
jgi:hypothetical protein